MSLVKVWDELSEELQMPSNGGCSLSTSDELAPIEIASFLDETGTFIPEYFAWKANLARGISAVLLVMGSPLIVFLTTLVYCTSRGPGIYSQKRIGKHGKEFTMYKIRTMRHDAEKETGPIWSQPNDPRLTFVGRIIRLLHLDELPQLYNVVRGDMCLVGPRPERPEIIDELREKIPGYLRRYRVLPGITGLAQIYLPPDVDIDSVRAKLVWDEEYIRLASLDLDIRILLCSALRMLGIRHGYAIRWLGLARRVTNGVPRRTDFERMDVATNQIVETTTEPHDTESERKTDGVEVPLDIDGSDRCISRVDITSESVEMNPHTKNTIPHSRNGKGKVPPVLIPHLRASNGHSESPVSGTTIPVDLPNHPR